jgi:hypothetical protein
MVLWKKLTILWNVVNQEYVCMSDEKIEGELRSEILWESAIIEDGEPEAKEYGGFVEMDVPSSASLTPMFPPIVDDEEPGVMSRTLSNIRSFFTGW